MTIKGAVSKLDAAPFTIKMGAGFRIHIPLCRKGGLAAFAAALPAIQAPCQEPGQRPNVLLIIADDMRPEMGCYGVEGVKTPNLDRLASESTLFGSAYCNSPVSGASRASMLTGVYPRHPSRFTTYDAWARYDAPWAEPLQSCLGRGGYHTISNGKVFHNISDCDSSWSEYPWRVHPDGYGKDWAQYNKWEIWMNSTSGNTINPGTMRGPFCESADTLDEAYLDGKVAKKTIEDLCRMKDSSKPFFIACGFWKPHLPFNAPKRYWDLYKRDSIPLAGNNFLPKGLPKEVHAPSEIRSYALVPDDLGEEEFQRMAKHGYWACVSYVDAQVGKILHALDSLDLGKKTIVIFLGDHGWQLGEHSFWGKHTLMERSTRVPLIVKVPGQKPSVSYSPVELVDIYPTLCELCGVSAPEGQLDGMSLLPIIRDPETKTKERVFIDWQGGTATVDGRFNFAVWPAKGSPPPMMLYDHRSDPEENVNVSGKRRYQKRIRRFREFLSGTAEREYQKEKAAERR